MNHVAANPQMSASMALNPDQFASADGQKINLIGIPREQLAGMLEERGHKNFRTKQLWHWLYWQGVTDFDAMSNLSKDFRRQLADEFVIERPTVSEALNSVDGTAKWLLKFPDGNEVETVHIPEADRGTLCVSSQVGCTLTCTFCHTGTQRLVRNLTASEVVGQLMLARDAFGEWPTPSDHSRMITNVVMMGMGEPLYNYDNVAAALRIVMDGEGISLSKRRITLSTSGVVPAMRKCGEELNVNLAVSLHAVDNDTRDAIMPINKKYPLEELLDACSTYPGVTNARRITFEYVMLKGINDSDADARQLVRLLRGIPSKINLIPFNPWPGSDYECSSARRIASFQSIVQEASMSAPVRTTRGEDILAACGQLKSESQKMRRSERDALAASHLAAQVAAQE
ncbi:MAG: 23S rRNA (adenine(2503)-C(2))-methyltransferase RlmN [Geminicoccus sp.]|nr:23S rRNA (adenine(2503)-C(2))-methyltransferase RlmN [Geminicoccus sp.]